MSEQNTDPGGTPARRTGMSRRAKVLVCLGTSAGLVVGAAAAAEDLKKVHAEVAAVRASTAQVAKAVEKASTKGRAASKAKGV